MPRGLLVPANGRPFTPGEMLREEFIEPLGLTQQQAAEALGIDRPGLNYLINGKRRVTPEMAMRLAIVFGTAPDFWFNCQMVLDLYEVKRSGRLKDLKRHLRPLNRRRPPSKRPAA